MSSYIFTFDNKSLYSENSSAALNQSGGTFHQTYPDGNNIAENSVFAFNGGSGFYGKESDFSWNSLSSVLRIRFMIDADAIANMHFVSLKNHNLKISLVNKDNDYVISGMVKAGHLYRNFTSSRHISKGKWHTITIYFAEYEADILIDNEIFARRIFTDKASASVGTDTAAKLRIGSFDSSDRISGYTNFQGAISGIELFTFPSLDMKKTEYSELDLIIKDADTANFMEVESMADDLLQSGYNLGSFIGSLSGNSCEAFKYQGGTILLGFNGAFFMDQEYSEKYFKVNGLNALGAPFSSEDGYIIYEQGGIFKTPKGYYVMLGDIFDEYLGSGAYDSIFGYPTSDTGYINFGTESIAYVSFDNAVLYQHGDDGVLQIDLEMHKYYRNLSVDDKCRYGYPMANTFTYNSRLIRLILTNGEIYQYKPDWFIAENYLIKHYILPKEFADYYNQCGGPDSKLSRPTSNVLKKSGISYVNFAGGVIVKHENGNFQAHTRIRFAPDKIVSGKIDDGSNSQAELVCHVTIKRNDQVIKDYERYPGGKGTHYGSTLFFENYVVPVENIQGSDCISVSINIYDFDKISKNDYLGTFSFTLDISNNWGLAQEYHMSGTQHQNVRMTAQGKDNANHGLGNNLLTYTVYDEPDTIKYDKNHYRENYHWRFRNYSAEEMVDGKDVAVPLSKDVFHRVFGSDESHYEDCKESGYGGHCFGLALESLYALHGMSRYSMPLSQYPPCPGYDVNNPNDAGSDLVFKNMYKELSENISARHLYQKGAAYIKWQKKKYDAGEIQNPASAFKSIIDRIDSEGTCLVTIRFTRLEENDDHQMKETRYGHTVVAYAHDQYTRTVDGVSGTYDRIYIADTNTPYLRYGRTIDEGSYLSLTAPSSDDNKVYLYTYNKMNTDSLAFSRWGIVFEMPFSQMVTLPKWPSKSENEILTFLSREQREILVAINQGASCQHLDANGNPLGGGNQGATDSVYPLFDNEDSCTKYLMRPKGNNMVLEITNTGNTDATSCMITLNNASYQIETACASGKSFRIIISDVDSKIPKIEIAGKEGSTYKITGKNRFYPNKVFRSTLSAIDGKLTLRLKRRHANMDVYNRQNELVKRVRFTSIDIARNPIPLHYISTGKYAEIHGITRSSAARRCRRGSIAGAVKNTRGKWCIPE